MSLNPSNKYRRGHRKGEEGEKGKGKGGDDDATPTITMPSEEEMGEQVSKEDFVNLVADSYFSALETQVEPEAITLSLQLLDGLVSEFLELARESAPPPPEPEPPVPREVPSPPPPSIDHIKGNVRDPLASLLLRTWDQSVEDYIESLKISFEELTTLRAARAGHFSMTRKQFHSYIDRPSMAMNEVVQLHQSINQIPMDMRYHDEVKAELHERVADTVRNLSTIIEQREKQCSDDLESLRSNGYTEYQAKQVVQVYASLIQAEVDRFHSTRRVLIDSFVGSQGGGAGAKLPDTTDGEVTSVDGDAEKFPESPPIFFPTLFGETKSSEEEDARVKSKRQGKAKSQPEADSESNDTSNPVAILLILWCLISKHTCQLQRPLKLLGGPAQNLIFLQNGAQALAEVDNAVSGGKGGKGKDKKGTATQMQMLRMTGIKVAQTTFQIACVRKSMLAGAYCTVNPGV